MELLKEKKIVKYNGKQVGTQIWEKLDIKEFEEIRKAYYTKPSFEEVVSEMKKGSEGAIKMYHINKYYFSDLIDKTTVHKAPFSVEDVYSSPLVMGHFTAKVKRSKKFFFGYSELSAEELWNKLSPEEKVHNIMTSIRLGGAGYTVLPSRFPVNTVDYILSKYNINNNYYDFSCGWGNRLFGALKNNINYFGTDPNYLLVDKLNEFSQDYFKHAKKNTLFNNNSTVDIKCSGSEILHEEWINKIGLAFSSPPYFGLEDYKIGEQSLKKNKNYEEWLNNYLKSTMENIYQYLTEDGYFIINIKNYSKYDLVNNSIELAEKLGFKYKTDEPMRMTSAPSQKERGGKIKEFGYVFTK